MAANLSADNGGPPSADASRKVKWEMSKIFGGHFSANIAIQYLAGLPVRLLVFNC